jgi:hypothetical protein
VNDVFEMNLEKLQFRFAKTMPEIPHEYVVRTLDDEADYVELFETIAMLGVIETFKGHRYRYWYAGDGYKYSQTARSSIGRGSRLPVKSRTPRLSTSES